MIANITNAAQAGLKHGALGLLNTDWGDGGHWQILPISYLGLALGAAMSWRAETNRDIDLPGVLEKYTQLWHARNRPGGFRDSITRLERLRHDYLSY